jgi:hypothetical protein
MMPSYGACRQKAHDAFWLDAMAASFKDDGVALALAVGSVAVVLAVAVLSAEPAQGQTCRRALVPVTGGVANEARYSFSCDGPVEGSYTVSASTASGDTVAGSVQTLDQAFVCTLEPEGGEEPEELEEGEDPDESGDMSSWECVGGAAAGRTIGGIFVAQQDPCAAALGLLVVTYRGSGTSAKAKGRTLLTIDCSQPPSATTPPSGGGQGQAGAQNKGLLGPLVSGVGISPSVFKAARRGASVARTVGARIRFKLSQSAQASFVVTRFLSGVRRNGGCVPQQKPKRGAKRCTRDVPLGSFTRRGATGVNGFRFTGRLAGRSLSPGEYRFGVTARSSNGATGALVSSPGFRIVR